MKKTIALLMASVMALATPASVLAEEWDDIVISEEVYEEAEEEPAYDEPIEVPDDEIVASEIVIQDDFQEIELEPPVEENLEIEAESLPENIQAQEPEAEIVMGNTEEVSVKPYSLSSSEVKMSEVATLSEVASGTCGKTLTWVLDESGVLTISGSGAMTNWSSYTVVPWYKNRSSITSVIIEKGVTTIGYYAFYGCTGLTSISIPEGVTFIGGDAFNNCKNLVSIELPESIKQISSMAFYSCKSLQDVYYAGSPISWSSIYISDSMSGNDPLLNATIHYAKEDPDPIPMSSCTVKFSESSYSYTGKEITPTISVYYGSNLLTEGADYTVSYSNNINAGTGKVTITGIGYYYTGTSNVNFTIKPANISGAEITILLGGDDYEIYEGEAITPTVYRVEVNSKKLTSDTDYTVSYSNNINVGTATVTITGKGNYTGTAKKNFTIKAASLSSSDVDAKIKLETTTYYYDGQKKTPAVTVKDTWGKKLVEGKDYTVSYSNNKDAGTAKVTVTGKGNYKGSVKASFKIKMLKGTSISRLKNTGSKQMTVQWKKVSGVTGYQIQYCKKGSKKNAKKITVPKRGTTSKKITGLKNGKDYNVRIRTYKTDSGNTYYSEWTSIETVYVDAPRISNTSLSMKVGGQLVVEILGTSKNVKWKSSNSSVASVKSEGQVGYVTGKKAGTATVSCTVGGKRFSCKVTVKPKDSITIRVRVRAR